MREMKEEKTKGEKEDEKKKRKKVFPPPTVEKNFLESFFSRALFPKLFNFFIGIDPHIFVIVFTKRGGSGY